MRCSRVRDRLMDYASADLLPGELHRINEHLMGCEDCRTALARAREASSALGLLGCEEPAPMLVDAVRARIVRDTRPARPVLLPRLAVGFSATALVALVVTGLLHHNPTEPTSVAVKPGGVSRSQAAAPIQERSVPSTTPTPEPAPMYSPKQNEQPVMPGRKSPRLADAISKPVKRVAGPNLDRAEPISPAEPDTDSEPVILIAVQPKEPEIYMMRLDSEEQEPATDITVVREFDAGGNIRSVTIRGEASPEDSADMIAPALDRTQLLDAPPAGDMRAEFPYAGGSPGNA